MKKLNHSKYKNTGIIFEILTRNLVTDVLNKRAPNSLSIIKRYFSEGSELFKELRLYQSLQEINSNLKSPDRLISLVIETYNKTIDREKLSREKYQLVGEIKRRFNEDRFFSSRVGNYKLLASIYKLFEYSASDNPAEHVNCRDVVLEHITGESQTENILTEVQDVWKAQNPDIRKLAFKIVVEKFNDKYQRLNEQQKVLLKRYINEDTTSPEFRDFIYSEVTNLKKALLRVSGRISDDVMRIKLGEAINLLDNIVASSVVKDEHLSSLLKYYELVEELK